METTDRRRDAAPGGAEGLAEADADAYRRDGYVVVRGRFDAGEVDAWQRECDRLWAKPGFVSRDNFRIQTRPRVDGGETMERMDWVMDISPVFRALADDPRVAEPAGSALGEPAMLFKDKVLCRPPGTMGYGLHQDFPYWTDADLPPDEIVTVLVAIDRVGGENGGLEVYAGYQEALLPPPADEPRDVDPATVDGGRAEMVDLAAGDMLLFHSLVPHRSPPNRSAGSRRTIFLTYAPARYADLYDRFMRRYADAFAATG